MTRVRDTTPTGSKREPSARGTERELRDLVVRQVLAALCGGGAGKHCPRDFAHHRNVGRDWRGMVLALFAEKARERKVIVPGS